MSPVVVVRMYEFKLECALLVIDLYSPYWSQHCVLLSMCEEGHFCYYLIETISITITHYQHVFNYIVFFFVGQ